MNDKASTRILQIAFSLVLGSVSIAFAQMDYDFPNGIHLAYAGGGPYRATRAFRSRTLFQSGRAVQLGETQTRKLGG